MSCHRETHHAETEKSDFSHVRYLVLRPWVLPAASNGRTAFFGGGQAAP
jgi:hypothetical protein